MKILNILKYNLCTRMRRGSKG
ncbi:hypothetical protein EMEDMD4_790183 [Sinorhizobium medicae]|uniref:Uncharacterized protein n=1 Tax=Sinorhizobium medicae TaxID=110321 RepID=A0A508X679_9HYPH|nr:hypothetical protein EMEDMD4_790183 [Sinorhizobium medicae]